LSRSHPVRVATGRAYRDFKVRALHEIVKHYPQCPSDPPELIV